MKSVSWSSVETKHYTVLELKHSQKAHSGNKYYVQSFKPAFQQTLEIHSKTGRPWWLLTGGFFCQLQKYFSDLRTMLNILRKEISGNSGSQLCIEEVLQLLNSIVLCLVKIKMLNCTLIIINFYIPHSINHYKDINHTGCLSTLLKLVMRPTLNKQKGHLF